MLTGGSAGEGYGDRTARFEGVLVSSGLGLGPRSRYDVGLSFAIGFPVK